MIKCLMPIVLFLLVMPQLCGDEPMAPGKKKEDAPTETPQEKKPATDPRLDRYTPEGTLRIFLIGMALSNEDFIKSTAIPVTEEEMKVLLGSPETKKPSIEEVKTQFLSPEIKVLKPGSKFKLPSGKEIVIPPITRPGKEIDLHVDGSPLPFRLHLQKEFWWVDALPLVTGRKAAMEKAKKVSPTP